jgi:hypothetical protein
MKKVFKAIGGLILGITIFLGIIITTILIVTFGIKIAFAVEPIINIVAAILLILDIVILVLALSKKLRPIVGIIMVFSSYIMGLSTLIYGFAVTLSLWGMVGVVIGIFMGGVGVIPIGLLAAMFHSQWGPFWSLLISIVLTLATGLAGALLINNSEKMSEEHTNIIDVEPSDERSWDDID